MCIPALLGCETDRNACIAARVQLIEILNPRAIAVSLEVRPRRPSLVVQIRYSLPSLAPRLFFYYNCTESVSRKIRSNISMHTRASS